MLEHMPPVIGHSLAGIRPGMEKLAYASAEMAAPETVSITSEAFGNGEAIPARYTADGARLSPPLRFRRIPPGTRSLALIAEDADSPTPAPLCHALVWKIDPLDGGGFQEAALDADAMPTARRGALVGKNSFLALGWLPPDPPPGHGPHRYALQIYALDAVPDLKEGAGRGAVMAALKGHVLAKGLLVGTYQR